MLITTCIITAVKIAKIGSAVNLAKKFICDEPINPRTACTYSEQTRDYVGDKINNLDADGDGSILDDVLEIIL